MSDTVSLSAQDLVAEGSDRACYRHPREAKYCIKVLHPECRVGRFWREVKYYRSLRGRNVDFHHLTSFHGLVKTNLGMGAVFDLVLDDDGRVSRSLEHYLAGDDRRFNDWIVNEIENLKQDLYDQWIVFHDLNPTKILVQRIGFDEFRLVVIDGIGHNHFIPLASFSSRLARKKLVGVWDRRYRQWYAAFPSVVGRLKPYPVIRS
jgi:hypothetical protein